MNRFFFALLVVCVLTWSAAGQMAAQSQTSGAASTNTSAGADKGSVQTQTDVSASQQVGVSRGKTESKSGQAETSGKASAGQSASVKRDSASVGSHAAGTINAVLTDSVNTRKTKDGQQVRAKTTSSERSSSGVAIPKGSKLIGHVTQAKARANGDSESALGIVFDKAVLKNGQEVPFHAVIQALAAPAQTASSALSDNDSLMAPASSRGTSSSGSGGGGLIGSTTSAATGVTTSAVGAAGSTAAGLGATTGGAVGQTVGSVGASAGGAVNSTAGHVSGLPGLTLNSNLSNVTQGSLITSAGKEVKLDSGTQMVLRLVAQE